MLHILSSIFFLGALATGVAVIIHMVRSEAGGIIDALQLDRAYVPAPPRRARVRAPARQMWQPSFRFADEGLRAVQTLRSPRLSLTFA